VAVDYSRRDELTDRDRSTGPSGHSGRPHGEQDKQGKQKDDSTGTVLLAMAANALIAVGKLFVGMITGSSAMLSEGAHSVADTTNEAFLLTALKRSKRHPDAQHPFGYGKERFFWSLIAAVGIFILGAGFSFIQAIQAFTESGGGKEAYLGAYIMLAVAFVLEGASWLRAVWQTRKEAREREKGVVQHIRESSDPTVKTVASEDTAALVGLLLAFVGLLLHELTGNPMWEGFASIGIALTLVFVAYALARDAKGLLIGEAADEPTRGRICDLLESYDGVDEVLEVLTMRIGTDQLLVAVRLDFSDDLDADRIEKLSARIDCDLHEQVPEVYQVFLDATDKATRRDRPDAQPYPDDDDIASGADHTEKMAATPDS
jgi:cation diffusion facilitator family transporter